MAVDRPREPEQPALTCGERADAAQRTGPPDQQPGPDPGSAGEAPTVVVRRSGRRKRTVTAYREAGNIVVLIPQRMSEVEEQSYVDDMVAKVLARERRSSAPSGDEELLRRSIDLVQRYLEPRLGYCPRPASVRWVTNQNRRWGSCTPAAGTIRLSHRMLPMPAWVVDYVLLHELAHLAEARHSSRFWELVEDYPDAERARGYLEGFQAGRHRP